MMSKFVSDGADSDHTETRHDILPYESFLDSGEVSKSPKTRQGESEQTSEADSLSLMHKNSLLNNAEEFLPPAAKMCTPLHGVQKRVLYSSVAHNQQQQRQQEDEPKRTSEADSLIWTNKNNRLNATVTTFPEEEPHSPHQCAQQRSARASAYYHQQQQNQQPSAQFAQVPLLPHHVAQQHVFDTPVYRQRHHQQRQGEGSNHHAAVTVPPVQELRPRYYHGAPVFRHYPHHQHQQPWSGTHAGSAFVMSHDDRIRGYMSGNGGTNRFPPLPLPGTVPWEVRLEELKAYKMEHGHFPIPRKGPWAKLSRWVDKQRAAYRAFMQAKKEGFPMAYGHGMTEERIRELEKIGFIWQSKPDAWEQKYKALKEYQKENGHCNVPYRYPPNPALGFWVTNQRLNYREFMKAKADEQPWKNPSVMEERIARLEALGFAWKLRPERKH